MTVIFTTGDFWIESLIETIPFLVVDTVTDSPLVNLTKPGRVVGITAVTLGGIGKATVVSVLNQALGVIEYGDPLTGIVFRGMTRIAGALNIPCIAMVFLRK